MNDCLVCGKPELPGVPHFPEICARNLIGHDWMDDDDPLETRMFFELMQSYRHAGIAVEEFEAVIRFLRSQYCVPRAADQPNDAS